MLRPSLTKEGRVLKKDCLQVLDKRKNPWPDRDHGGGPLPFECTCEVKMSGKSWTSYLVPFSCPAKLSGVQRSAEVFVSKGQLSSYLILADTSNFGPLSTAFVSCPKTTHALPLSGGIKRFGRIIAAFEKLNCVPAPLKSGQLCFAMWKR
jgi:hypothetical protein